MSPFLIELEGEAKMNEFIGEIAKKHGKNSIVDHTCPNKLLKG